MSAISRATNWRNKLSYITFGVKQKIQLSLEYFQNVENIILRYG